MKFISSVALAVFSLLFPLATFADDAIPAEAIHTLWIVVAGAMVFLMQPGFALLESGMARAKNTVNVMMKNYMDICVGTLLFWMLGYGLMFGSNPTGWFGTDLFAMSEGGGMDYTVLFFQMMFAATAATIVSGAMAERTNYFGYLIGAMGITAFIYPVFGSWVWNEGGWLRELGFIDFAGSTVVHSVGAWCALAGIIILGPRLGRFSSNGKSHAIPGHNLGYITVGGFLLWFGWFGFNGGSTLLAGTDIGPIVLNTHMAGAAGAVGAILMSVITRQPALMTNAVNGSIGGLVAITAGCASMDIPYAVLTGFIGGIVCVLGFIFLEKLRYDDVVGAVSVHGFAGVWGTLAAGIFLKGNMFDLDVIMVQLLGVSVAFLWVFFSAFLMYSIIAKTVGLRVSPQHEQRGLDITEHGEVGYPEFNRDAAYLSEHVKDLQRL